MSIPARYPGLCPECGERWQPGDLIRGETSRDLRDKTVTWRHAVCPEAVEKMEGDVCPVCFLRRSLSGECGCES